MKIEAKEVTAWGAARKSLECFRLKSELLALNVAFEAARAGDSATGFAVIADEVRGTVPNRGKDPGVR